VPQRVPSGSELYRDLGAPPARLWSRVAALSIDLLVLATIEALSYLVVGAALWGAASEGGGDDPGAWDRGATLATALLATQLPVLAFWFWNRVVRVSRGGSSAGMRLCGIRLVALRSGTAPSVDTAILREVVGTLLLLPLGLGLLPMLWRRDHRGSHDLAAGVVMIEPPV